MAVINLNAGEFGETLRINLREDLSSADMEIAFKKPCGDEVKKPATIGADAITDGLLGRLLANQYIEYVIEEGLIDMAGNWYVRAISTKPEKISKTDWEILRVKG